VGEDCVEAQHGARTGNPDDHLSVLGTPGGQLEIATAYQVKAAGLIALGEEGGFPRERNGAGGELEIGKDGAPERAEPSWAPVGASRAPNRGGSIDRFLSHLGYVCVNYFYIRHHLAPLTGDEAQSTAPNSPTSARVVNQVENTSGPIRCS
jgi:hypothetical protein